MATEEETKEALAANPAAKDFLELDLDKVFDDLEQKLPPDTDKEEAQG